ncbi:hypothetical protein HII31_08030 [Pseudocercospora fuligena]|uniref:Uncharacterized protein n=1 Tax=Pseudocercospora fuligena TaxID=685502 RepID=A0A8H6RGX6_9PEZI|nr:hypothetical protein HII31_08030 [Pseudocercospora fuligena]
MEAAVNTSVLRRRPAITQWAARAHPKPKNYLCYRAAELRSFIKERTGKDANPQDTFCDLIAQLHYLDANATFRFMDLPPEIRLLVYAELLHTEGYATDKKVYPQILATSKFIYNEAHKDFVENTCLDIQIDSTPHSRAFGNWVNHIPSVSISVMTRCLEDVSGLMLFSELVNLRSCIVHNLGSARRVKLKITIHGIRGIFQSGQGGPVSEHSTLVTFLLLVVSALRRSKVCRVNVELHDQTVTDGRQEISAQDHFDMMWPLCYFIDAKSTGECSITGIDQEVEEFYRSRSGPIRNGPDILDECANESIIAKNVSFLLKNTGVEEDGISVLGSLATEYQEHLEGFFPSWHTFNAIREQFDRIYFMDAVQKMRAEALSMLRPEDAAVWAQAC